MHELDIHFIFSAVDFMVRLIIVVIFFLIASTLKKYDPDVIRSRLFLEYTKITKSFTLMFFGSIFFLIAAVIEYIVAPLPGDDLFVVMKISLTVFQVLVIYFIATLNGAISHARDGGM
ncbi:MAG: hypothetical protein M8349_08430 [ANME-2 cluster archaeon]|nr:hypothetical protein [ANME-2 cluster archaeon]